MLLPCTCITAQAACFEMKTALSDMQIYVPPHPLIQHWLAIARNDMTPPPIFRAALAELGRILVYEAGRDWLPTMQQQINSPVGVADATFVDPTQPVKVSHCT